LRKLARKKAFGLQTKRHGTCDKMEAFGDVGALRKDSNQNGENNAQSDWFPTQHFHYMKLPSDVIIPIEKLTDYLLVFQLKNDKRVEGMLKGVNQCDLFVVTVWIMRVKEEGVYRFVTLKPWRKNHAAT